MGLTDWMGTFGRAQSLDLSNDLERGYEAALLIQSIELEHYNDRPVRPELELRLPRGMQAQILRRFRAALQVCRQTLENVEPYRQELSGQEIRQIQLVEAVASRYDDRRQALPAISRSPEVLPRSLLGVVDQVRRQLDPDAEASVIAGFRRRRDSTLVSLRILLLLILVPILMQQVSRTYIVSPLVDRLSPEHPLVSYPRPQLEEKAVQKLRLYQAEIEFEALLNDEPLPTREQMQQKLNQKAHELEEESQQEGSHAVKNVLSDGFGLLGFLMVCVLGQRDIQVLRGFIDEMITDIFVGFHSPEGWTVILDGIAHHLGLPARENFIMLFIATFPVVLATIFKYWIFRYLNRVSPSSVATLRNMNGGG
jgi:hypothetical protein